MSKRFMLVTMVVTLLSSLAIVTSVLSQSAKKDTVSMNSPEPCTCSHESLLTMSKGLQQKLEVFSGRSFKGGEKFLNSIYGSIYNCECGKSQCVVTSTTRGLNSISCVRNSFF